MVIGLLAALEANGAMKRFLIPGLLVAIALVEMGSLLFSAAPFAYRHDWNIPLFHNALISMWHETDAFTVWNREQLGSPPFYPTLAPYLAMISLLASVHLSAGVIARMILLGTFMLGGFGMMTFLRLAGSSKWPSVCGAAFYMLTPFLFNQICTGVLADSLSYAMIPWVAAFFVYAATVPREGPNFILFSAASGTACAIVSFHPVYLALNLIVLCLLAFIYRAYRQLGIAVAAVFLTDAYIILPLIPSAVSQTHEFLQAAPSRVVYDLSPSLWETVRLTGFKGYFVENLLRERGVTVPWILAGYVLAGVAITGLVRGRTRFGVTAGVALAGLWIIAAGTSVLGYPYYFLVSHAPAGAAFRESYRFTGVSAFLEAVGIAAFCATFAAAQTSRMRYAIYGSVALLLFLEGLPFWGNGLATQLPVVHPPEVAERSYNVLKSAPGSSRMLYLPLLLPVGAKDRNFLGIDPMISWPPRASFGNYLLWPFLKALASDLYHGQSGNLRAMLSLANVQYVDRRYWLDERFAEATGLNGVGFDDGKFTDANALRNLRPLLSTPVLSSPQEKIWALPHQDQNQTLPTARLNLVTGSFAHAALLQSDGILPAYVGQMDDRTQLERIVRHHPEIALTVVDGNYFDVLRALIEPQFLVQPGAYASEVNANLDWASFNGSWMSWWWYRDRYAQSLEDVALVGPLTRTTLTIPYAQLDSPAVHILVKAFSGPDNGSIWIRAGTFETALNTYSHVQSNDALWFDVGMTPRFDEMSLRNVRGENVVAEIAVLPEAVYQSVRARGARLLSAARLRNLITTPGRPISIAIFHPGRYVIRLASIGEAAAAFKQRVLLDGRWQTIAVGVRERGGRVDINLRAGSHTFYFRAANRNVGGFWIEPASFPRSRNMQISRVVELNTRFSPGWNVPEASEHLRIAGFANGWIVEKPDAFTISYRPLILAYIGRAISILVILGVLAGLMKVDRKFKWPLRST
ncbi:MAG: hypothetical protein DLM50_02090 [Candidatus Meridianibacter frigidus]|nr:MAG: hypothetical protein DLM50_02090 [Candidatus Eremiobacteraeota bacterium]